MSPSGSKSRRHLLLGLLGALGHGLDWPVHGRMGQSILIAPVGTLALQRTNDLTLGLGLSPFLLRGGGGDTGGGSSSCSIASPSEEACCCS